MPEPGGSCNHAAKGKAMIDPQRIIRWLMAAAVAFAWYVLFQVLPADLLIGGGLAALLVILLPPPRAKLVGGRPVVGWCFALACGAYLLSHVDILPNAMFGPFGIIDEAGAVVAGINAAEAAIAAGKANRQQTLP